MGISHSFGLQIEMPSTATFSVCAYLGNLLAFGSALKRLYFATIMLRE